MPAVRTIPRDVLIKVPKVEPYSNSYVPPTVRAKNAAAAADAVLSLPASTAIDTEDAPKEVDQTTDRTERGNSPTLPFLSTDRLETQTIDMSKAATSSAGWNSLLIWARRQRGPQWDSSTAIWQVDKDSEEYYSFCQDPAQLHRESADPAIVPTNAAQVPDAVADDDKGPLRYTGGIKEETSASTSRNNSPPPTAQGRSARLLRR